VVGQGIEECAQECDEQSVSDSAERTAEERRVAAHLHYGAEHERLSHIPCILGIVEYV
jgi:hypothetical protein